jgi:non-canonical poly(A) RNA polymerase PAPD5/7
VRVARVIPAKLPIIKCVEAATGLQMDVALGAANGCRAVDLVTAAVHANPPLRPLVLVLKALLAQQGLNEVYTGGVGSYTLLTLVLAHLKMEAAAVADGLEEAAEVLRGDFGVLLRRFLRRYGVEMDTQTMAVSVARGGLVPMRELLSWRAAGGREMARPRPGHVLIEDPQHDGCVR